MYRIKDQDFIDGQMNVGSHNRPHDRKTPCDLSQGHPTHSLQSARARRIDIANDGSRTPCRGNLPRLQEPLQPIGRWTGRYARCLGLPPSLDDDDISKETTSGERERRE